MEQKKQNNNNGWNQVPGRRSRLKKNNTPKKDSGTKNNQSDKDKTSAKFVWNNPKLPVILPGQHQATMYHKSYKSLVYVIGAENSAVGVALKKLKNIDKNNYLVASAKASEYTDKKGKNDVNKKEQLDSFVKIEQKQIV